MRIIKSLIVILLCMGCNNPNVTLKLEKVIDNQVYFKIENNKHEIVEVLIPKNGYLCYEGLPSLYDNYFTISIIGDQPEQAYVTTYYHQIESTIEEIKLDDYEIIKIGLNDEYQGKLIIPDEQNTECLFRPIIENEVGLSIVKKNETDTIVYKSNLVKIKDESSH